MKIINLFSIVALLTLMPFKSHAMENDVTNQLVKISLPGETMHTSQALHPFEHKVALGYSDGIQLVSINDTDKYDFISIAEDNPTIMLLKYNPQATLLAYKAMQGSKAGTGIVDLINKRTTHHISTTACDFEFNEEGNTLVIGGDKCIIIWDLENNTQKNMTFGQVGPGRNIRYISRAYNGNAFIWNSASNKTVIWDLQSPDKLRICKTNPAYLSIFGEHRGELVGYQPLTDTNDKLNAMSIQVYDEYENQKFATAEIANTLGETVSHVWFSYCPQLKTYFTVLQNEALNKISINEFAFKTLTTTRIDKGQFDCYGKPLFSPDGSKLFINAGRNQQTMQFYYVDLIELLNAQPSNQSNCVIN